MEGKYLSGEVHPFDIREAVGKGTRENEKTVKKVKKLLFLWGPRRGRAYSKFWIKLLSGLKLQPFEILDFPFMLFRGG